MNEGCVPTKAMIRSAEVMHLVARRAAEFGVEIEGPVRFNLATAVARKDAIVGGIVDGIYGALERRREAITFLRGQARFLKNPYDFLRRSLDAHLFQDPQCIAVDLLEQTVSCKIHYSFSSL